MTRRKLFILIITLLFAFNLNGQNRWSVNHDGSISWTVKPGEVHTDNIEMSGKFISVITTYGIDEKGKLVTAKQLVFPMLRTVPNDTHASLSYTFSSEAEPVIKINNRPAAEETRRFSLRGVLVTEGTISGNINITSEFFPSTDKPLAIEKYTIENRSEKEIIVDIEDFEKVSRTHREKSVYDVYEISAKTTGAGIYPLKPGQQSTFGVLFTGRKISDSSLIVDIEKEYSQRKEFINLMFNNLTFLSPDTVLNRMFDFAKIRAMESIFETKGGLVHSPGGGSYYAAIWANDQAEYANPFFAYTGYSTAI